MNPDWDLARYLREKRDFIESRLLFRWVYFDAALIFTATWAAAWFCSFVLLKLGLANMPQRYAISFLFSYLAFILCVRVWADFVRTPCGGGDWNGALDFPSADGEGCLVVLAALLLGMIAAAIFSMVGGLPLLLEAAFEVAFAGVVVRRISRKHRIGQWARTLVRNTWPHALSALLVWVAVAAWLQSQAPGARTFAQAVRVVMSR